MERCSLLTSGKIDESLDSRFWPPDIWGRAKVGRIAIGAALRKKEVVRGLFGLEASPMPLISAMEWVWHHFIAPEGLIR